MSAFHRCFPALVLAFFWVSLAAAKTDLPNVVIIFMDDMGYGDVGAFGAKNYQTPHIDSLARDGSKLTNFHVPQPVCSASRMGLMTGCYPNRVGIHGALGPKSTNGIHANEVTLAELVKQKGYATCAVGKWHLGTQPVFLPTRHGFDEYYGLPYSNDMWPFHPEAKPGTFPNLPLFDNEQIVDADVTAKDQENLTRDYTKRAVSFIERSQGKPFLLYLAHSMVHVPLFVSETFQGKSGKGLFAEVMMEVDWSVGEVLAALKRTGVEENTWVIFTSDNGPWLSYGDHAGSAGPLREGKGTCWEGGTRVPCLMRWPGHLAAGSTNDSMLMTIDLLPTLAKRIGAELPSHPIDGKDVWSLLTGQEGAKPPHEFYPYYYEKNELQAIVSGDGRWKLQLPHTYRTLREDLPPAKEGRPTKYRQVKLEKAELYDLKTDLAESQNVAEKHPEIVAQLERYAEQIRDELGDGLQQRPTGKGTREPGMAE